MINILSKIFKRKEMIKAFTYSTKEVFNGSGFVKIRRKMVVFDTSDSHMGNRDYYYSRSFNRIYDLIKRRNFLPAFSNPIILGFEISKRRKPCDCDPKRVKNMLISFTLIKKIKVKEVYIPKFKVENIPSNIRLNNLDDHFEILGPRDYLSRRREYKNL